MTCTDCNHEHAGIDLAGICIGCPCEHVVDWHTHDGVDEALCATCGCDWPCDIVKGES